MCLRTGLAAFRQPRPSASTLGVCNHRLNRNLSTSFKPTMPLLPSRQFEDVRCATLLSELVYRAAESANEAAFRQAQASVEEAVGASLSHVRCHKSGGQRFLVGETEDAIYVAFQGTKSAIDWLANLNFFHGHFGWHHHHQQQHHKHHHNTSSSLSSASSSSSLSTASSSSSLSSSASSTKSRGSSSSRAHIGFLKRANSAAVSISELHSAAAAAGKRLVLTGHSLGGAVAVLTTVRLLRSLAAAGDTPSSSIDSSGSNLAAGFGMWDDLSQEPRVRCISFATPAMANTDLLQEVTAAGWDQYITNIILPEDPVVPFVNLLLKAPASPSQAPNSSIPHGLFTGGLGLDSPSSSSLGSEVPDLSRAHSQESQVSLTATSWSDNLTLDPELLSQGLSRSLSAAGASAAAALQPLQDSLQAAADSWIDTAPPELILPQHQAASRTSLNLAFAGDTTASLQASSAATAADAASMLGDSMGSRELSAWLAAARDAVKQQAGPQPSPRSLQNSSRAHSSSGNSLYSLQSDTLGLWPASSLEEDSSSNACSSALSPDSTAPISPQGRGYAFGMPIIASWALDDSSSLCSPASSATHTQESAVLLSQLPEHNTGDSSHGDPATTEPPPTPADSGRGNDAAAADVAANQQGPMAGSSQSRGRLGAKVVRQLQRLQQQLGGTRVGRLAWIGGALAAGARCAAALAAPSAAAGPHFSLLALLPQALAGPAALAVLHFVGHAAYQAALPTSHPLGQQWVMTGSGLEPVAKPLTSYPRTGEGLGLQELGGLFPGHRMIAYRRRLANIISQSSGQPAQQ